MDILNKKIRKYKLKLFTVNDLSKDKVNLYKTRYVYYTDLKRKYIQHGSSNSSAFDTLLAKKKDIVFDKLDNLKCESGNKEEIDKLFKELESESDRVTNTFNVMQNEYQNIANELVKFAEDVIKKADDIKSGKIDNAGIVDSLNKIKNKITSIKQVPIAPPPPKQKDVTVQKPADNNSTLKDLKKITITSSNKTKYEQELLNDKKLEDKIFEEIVRVYKSKNNLQERDDIQKMIKNIKLSMKYDDQKNIFLKINNRLSRDHAEILPLLGQALLSDPNKI